MKLIEAFNKFCAKQTEKKNQRLLKKYDQVRQEATTASVLALVAVTVFPPAIFPVLHYANKEQRLKKKLQKRGLQVSE